MKFSSFNKCIHLLMIPFLSIFITAGFMQIALFLFYDDSPEHRTFRKIYNYLLLMGSPGVVYFNYFDRLMKNNMFAIAVFLMSFFCIPAYVCFANL